MLPSTPHLTQEAPSWEALSLPVSSVHPSLAQEPRDDYVFLPTE